MRGRVACEVQLQPFDTDITKGLSMLNHKCDVDHLSVSCDGFAVWFSLWEVSSLCEDIPFLIRDLGDRQNPRNYLPLIYIYTMDF